MKTAARAGTVIGLAIVVVHTGLALYIFAQVHSSNDGQAGFAWFLFMSLDYPTTVLAWDYVAHTGLIRAAYDWGNTWGDGKNVRALVLHGVLGGLHWFLIGWIAGYVFWPRVGLLPRQFAKRDLTARSTRTRV